MELSHLLGSCFVLECAIGANSNQAPLCPDSALNMMITPFLCSFQTTLGINKIRTADPVDIPRICYYMRIFCAKAFPGQHVEVLHKHWLRFPARCALSMDLNTTKLLILLGEELVLPKWLHLRKWRLHDWPFSYSPFRFPASSFISCLFNSEKPR